MAKTYTGLYPQIVHFDNLYHGWRKARRGKRYKPTAAAFERNLDSELLALHNELSEENWQPGGFRSFTIHEPKRRKISAAPFRDRVVHHALVRVIEPIEDTDEIVAPSDLRTCVFFVFKNDEGWEAGDYSAELYFDGELVGRVAFEV